MAVHQVNTEAKCPGCDKLLDSATNVDPGPENKPQKDDVSLCFGCGEILVFKEDLSVRVMGAKEYLSLPQDVAMQLGKVSILLARAKDAAEANQSLIIKPT